MNDMTMAPTVTLSDRAAARIARLLTKEPSGASLRVSVEGGGCSGFQYGFNFVPERNEDDLVIEKGGARVLVDATSLEYMSGSEIDFVDALIGQSFQIRNPHATSSCGCGVSFSV